MQGNPPIHELHRAIAALSRPLGPLDRSSGWDTESRRSMLRWMQEILAKAQQGIDVRDDCRMIGRNLDEIETGPLYETVIAVQRASRGE